MTSVSIYQIIKTPMLTLEVLDRLIRLYSCLPGPWYAVFVYEGCSY